MNLPEVPELLCLSKGTIYDGSGAEPYIADLLISKGKIAAIGKHASSTDATHLDASGLAIAPGFIDLHSHSDLAVLSNGTEKTMQGVTTELVGNCGFSAFPCGRVPVQAGEYNRGILGDSAIFDTATAYLTAARSQAQLAHIESLVGHGTLRTAVASIHPDSSHEQQIATMCGMLREALEEGAAGFSTGLMYAPGATAPHSELEALCHVVARQGKLYTSHIRSYSWTLLEAVEEQIDLARQTGCRLQISHLQAVGQANWSKLNQAIEAIDAARAEGIDIAFDAYPWLAGSTVLSQLLPQESFESGFPGFLSLLEDPARRASLELYLHKQTAQRWSDIFIVPASQGHEECQHAHGISPSIEEISNQRGTSPESTVLDLLVESEGQAKIIAFNQSEENLRQVLAHPLCSVITDGLYGSESPHPRLTGTFPFLLGELCRERRWLSLSEAIHKITALPANRMSLQDRGQVLPGKLADLVVFNPESIATEATYNDPFHSPYGVHLVLRAGVPVYGSLTFQSSLLDK